MTSIVYIVDDDDAVREALRFLLEQAGYRVKTFADGAAFLSSCGADCAGCVVLDLAMPGMSGLEVQAELKRRDIPLPVVFLSGTGGIPSVVRAVRGGALDFLEKPVQSEEILDRVAQALELDRQRRERAAAVRDIRERHQRLSPREREVMALVVAGLSSKQIARDLGLSPRTVEQHRAHIMYKMAAANITELVSMAAHCIESDGMKENA